MEFNLYTVDPSIDGVVGWWLPGANGYTQDRRRAGRFSLEEAIRHSEDCGQDEIRVAMVPVCEHPGGSFQMFMDDEGIHDGVRRYRIRKGPYINP